MVKKIMHSILFGLNFVLDVIIDIVLIAFFIGLGYCIVTDFFRI